MKSVVELEIEVYIFYNAFSHTLKPLIGRKIPHSEDVGRA
jgi:hypothetical protein